MQTIALELIGKKIREERVKHGWTQKDLSEKLFVDTSTMKKKKKGKNIGNLEKLVLVANSLNIDVMELIAAGVSNTIKQ